MTRELPALAQDLLTQLDAEEAKEHFPVRLRVSIGSSSLASFAREAGLSTTALRNYLDGSSVPKLDNLVSMARLAGVTVGWLAAGETTAPDLSEGKHEPTVRVPIYSAHLGASRIGAGGEPTDEIVSYGDVWVEWLRDQARVNPARAFIAPIYGSSMLRLYANGDLVVGETVDELERDDTYALWHDEQLLVKHVRRARGGVDLISENPSFPLVQLRGDEVTPERFRIIGRVAGKVTGHIV